MKKNIAILFFIFFIFGQRSLFAMDLQRTILIRITDVSGPNRLKYTLQVPYYRENRRTYVLFDDIYNEINRQNNISDARLLNLLYYPDGKNGFVDYDRERIFLNTRSLDDILVVKPEDNV